MIYFVPDDPDSFSTGGIVKPSEKFNITAQHAGAQFQDIINKGLMQEQTELDALNDIIDRLDKNKKTLDGIAAALVLGGTCMLLLLLGILVKL